MYESRSPQPHVERALAPVHGTGRLESQHGLAQLRRLQPQRDLPAQHPAVGIRGAHALSGDHQHDARALGAGNAQETHERIVSVGLGEAVQIDAGIETGAAAREALPQAAIEIGKRRNRLFARFRLLGRTKGVGSPQP